MTEAIDPVLRDARVSGAPLPTVTLSGVKAGAAVVTVLFAGADGTAHGFEMRVETPRPQRVAEAADRVQEWIIEELWAHGSTNWPVCPRHPNSHPLRPVERDDTAVWICPVSGESIAEIGAL